MGCNPTADDAKGGLQVGFYPMDAGLLAKYHWLCVGSKEI